MNHNPNMKKPAGRFLADPELSYTLPSNYYFDQKVYEAERDSIFFKSWLVIARQDELAEPGSYVTETFFDQPVVVVRARDGKLRGFYNVCKHRGHLLVTGRGNTPRLRCPFHAWSYDLDGRLVSAPNAENVRDFNFEEFNLTEIRVEEFARMVFVNLDPDAVPLKDMVPGLEQEFRDAVPGFDDLKWVRQDPYSFNANWKMVFDGLECYHCPYIHPGSMGAKDDRLQRSFEMTEHRWHSKHLSRGNKEVLSGQGEWGLGPEAQIYDFHLWYVWPNLYFMAHPGPSNFKVAHSWPTGPEQSIRFVEQFTRSDPPSDYDVTQMARHRTVFEQDIAAMESVQRGLHAKGYTSGRLMVDRERSWRSEHGTHHFNNLVWVALNGPNY